MPQGVPDIMAVSAGKNDEKREMSKMELALFIITIALILVVGSALLIGNRVVDRMVHEDSREAEALLAAAAARNRQRTSA